MYYTHKCTYCSKVFYTFHNNKTQAARILYTGIKKHLIFYDEDRKEYELDGSEEREVNEMYVEMIEMTEPPNGGYMLE